MRLEATINPTRSQTLERAGHYNPNCIIHRIWEEAGSIGFQAGSHHAKILAGATCGEMAQISPELEPYFESTVQKNTVFGRLRNKFEL